MYYRSTEMFKFLISLSHSSSLPYFILLFWNLPPLSTVDVIYGAALHQLTSSGGRRRRGAVILKRPFAERTPVRCQYLCGDVVSAYYLGLG